MAGEPLSSQPGGDWDERTSPHLLSWLMAHGGPAIRYRTAAELRPDSTPDELARLRAELLDSAQVSSWLARLVFRTGLNQVHGADATTYETVMGKLTQLGCRAGMALFDERTAPYRDWLAREMECPARDILGGFLRIDVGTFLAIAGYGREPAVAEYLAHRLETLHALACRGDYCFYDTATPYRSIPAGFRGRPMLRPELFAGGEWRLPLIHDVHALAEAYELSDEPAARARIQAVIEYILRPEYQALPVGYGIIPAGPGHYYACGWSAHLSGHHPPDVDPFHPDGLVQRVALLGRFPAARQHPWWQAARARLEAYRTPQGTYRLPRAYLPERRTGYWIAGAHMGLEENRRPAEAIEVESTFWMMPIGSVSQRVLTPESSYGTIVAVAQPHRPRVSGRLQAGHRRKGNP